MFRALTTHKLECVCLLLAIGISRYAPAVQGNSVNSPVAFGANGAAQFVCLSNESEKDLFDAIKLKDPSRVQALLVAGVNPNARTEINFEHPEHSQSTCATALMVAARVGDARIVEVLLAARADVNARDNIQRHIWDYAVGYQTIRLLTEAAHEEGQQQLATVRLETEMDARLQLSKVLLTSGADLEAAPVGDWSQTALFHAVDAAILTGDLRILKLLIASGAHLNATNNSILAYATMRTQFAQVRQVTGKAPALNAPGAVEVVDVLLKAGANVNAARNGFTAIMLEASGSLMEGTVKRLKVLLAAGAEVNPRSGEVPLLAALKPNWNDNRSRADAIRDQVEVIKLLLAAGADPNRKDTVGTALHAAIDVYGPYNLAKDAPVRESIIQTLMTAGADPNAKDNRGRTVLLHALDDIFGNGTYEPGAEAEKIRLLTYLISAGADVNTPDLNGKTALKEAILNRSDEVVHAILRAKANVNERDRDGAAPLHLAAAGGRRVVVARQLIEAGANINIRDSEARTPLMLAITSSESSYSSGDKSCDEMVRFLIDAKADVNARSNDGDTALIIAARQYGSAGDRWRRDPDTDEFILNALLAAGARVRDLNQTGESALSVLVAKSAAGNLTLIRKLIAEGRRVDARWYPRVEDLLPAIRRAAGHSNTEVVQELIMAGADVKGVDEAGKPVLIIAVTESGNVDVVRQLVKAGANVNARDKNGDTALIAAVREYLPGGDEFIKNALHRDFEVVRVLLAEGASITAVGNDGQDVLGLAEKSGNQKLIALLAQAMKP